MKRTPATQPIPMPAAPSISPELLTRALSEIARLHPAEDRRSFYTPFQTELERALAHPHPENSTNSTSAPKTPPPSTYSTPGNGALVTPVPFTNQPLRAAA